MLQLTTEAADLLREVRAENSGADTDLLRVSPQQSEEGVGLRIGFVANAVDGDAVGESEGVPLCVAAELVEALDDQVIDVTDSPAGGKGLVLRAA